MWVYKKMLLHPVNIKCKDIKLAKYLVTQFGGPYGELGAALRYLTQRYTMPDNKGKALLTDIGTEELGHVEMICTMVYQLLDGASEAEMEAHGLTSQFVEHAFAPFPSDSNGVPFSASSFAVTGDPVADLAEDMAAEEKARIAYERLIKLTKDEGLKDALTYLKNREIAHYNAFKQLYEEYKSKGL